MSNRWLFFPAPASSGALQVITWTMTSGDAATITSTGQNIINPSKTNQLRQGSTGVTRPRFWNGSESLNSGATFGGGRYNFSSSSATRTWWNNYSVTATVNGGAEESLGSPVVSTTTQNSYLGCLTSLSSLAASDVIVFTISGV